MTLKSLTPGSPIYVLIKGDKYTYKEGVLNSIGQSRVQPGQLPMFVSDFTYQIDGTTYTDVIGDQDLILQTSKLGAISLIAPDIDTIIRELKISLKNSEDYLKSTETEIPKQQQRIVECKELIASLDKDYAEKKALDARITKLEEGTQETNSMLKEILKKLNN